MGHEELASTMLWLRPKVCYVGLGGTVLCWRMAQPLVRQGNAPEGAVELGKVRQTMMLRLVLRGPILVGTIERRLAPMSSSWRSEPDRW